MSGIVGIYNRDGAPIERAILQSLVDFIAYRGPDAREIWIESSIGLGHTLLRTTKESFSDRQPAGFEDRYWITADARLDSRTDLLAVLDLSMGGIDPSVPDSDLILRAYAKWGTACVEHLRGDFSFAIWDSCNKQLFCARDQFGIKPFYYASIGSIVIFSNTLDCIRRHPAVSGRLNDLAIADFLLFDMIREQGTTSFADIQRLPPAHTLVCRQDGISLRRYWVLPVSTPIRHKRPTECVEQFRELLDRVVADRLRTNNVGVLMSGGLDSPTPADGKNIKCKVLACHGADDPFVSAKDLAAFQSEMRDNKVDWQLISYGDAVHSFTQPMAGNDKSKGAAYNERADKRSWEDLKQFLNELFGPTK